MSKALPPAPDDALDSIATLDDTGSMQPTPNTRQSYRGGKAGAGVYQKLINQMPPHTTYIECFLGHGAVLLNKRPAHHNIGLDLDPQAVKVVRARLVCHQSDRRCSVNMPDD